MHEVIQHTGIASHLDCWRILAEQIGFTSLEEFAKSNPSFEMLQEMSEKLAIEFIAGPDMSTL